MYHPEVVEKRIRALEKASGLHLHRYSVEESSERQQLLQGLWDEKNEKAIRDLTRDENDFAINESLLSTHDFRYWADRYAFLNSPTGELKRIDFWESQEIALGHIAQGELEAWKNGGDNLWDWLKARQLGATQVSATLISHRLFFHSNQRAIVASDEPGHSLELSRRIELIFNNMPWWMRPHRQFHVKGTEMYFDRLNCALVIGHGRKEGGGLGQGQTTNIFHFTELPDWESFAMIEEDFLPTVPLHPTSVGLMESTARGKHDQWHQHFKLAWSGKSRFKAFFIPWYAEKTRYSISPPSGWVPTKLTQLHAAQVEQDSPRYMRGRTVRLTPGQQYFWEFTRGEYDSKGKLGIFLQEYASNHLEAFQNINIGMFDDNLILKLRNTVKPFIGYDLAVSEDQPRTTNTAMVM